VKKLFPFCALLSACSANLSPPFPVFEADERDVATAEYCEQRLECSTPSRLADRTCRCIDDPF
jgi:hypothetical protein